MLELWLKVLHIASLSIWAAGLLWLPGLLLGFENRSRAEAVRVYRFSRFGYDGVVSPSAVVAVGSGTALIFVAEATEPWLYLKLACIGGMVVVHMLIGRSLDWEERKSNPPKRLHRLALLMSGLLFITAILWLVLQKPAFDDDVFPAIMRETQDQDELLPWSWATSSASLLSSSSSVEATPT